MGKERATLPRATKHAVYSKQGKCTNGKECKFKHAQKAGAGKGALVRHLMVEAFHGEPYNGNPTHGRS